MAKRSPAGEEPYRPLLDINAISQAVAPVSAPPADAVVRPAPPPKVVQDWAKSSSQPILSPVERREPWRAVAAAPELAEKLDQEKRMLLTRRESEAVERLVSNMGCRLNTQLKLSHVLRAVVNLLLNAEDQLNRRAGEALPLVRPPNGDIRALQRFEKQIGQLVLLALRDAGPDRS